MIVEVPESKKLKFTNQLSDRTVKDGDANVTLTCQLSEMVADADVTWYKDGKV